MRRRVEFKWVALGALVVALLLAGIVSYYASASPDGLEHVATEQGFIDTAKGHSSADSPMADYGTKGVDNPRLSVGIAGITGTLIVLLLAGGLTFVVRRRQQPSST